MKERFGVTNPKAQQCRFHVQTGGVTLTAQQPDNNVVRVALQTLAAVLGGCQSLHTNGTRRGPRPPHRGLGPARPAHPAGGGPRVGGGRHRGPPGRQLRGRGGDRRARERRRCGSSTRSRRAAGRSPPSSGATIQREIQESAYRFQRQVESGERVIVGRQPLPGGGGGAARATSSASTPRSSGPRSSGVRALRARRRPGPWKAALDALEARGPLRREPRARDGGRGPRLGHGRRDRGPAARGLRRAPGDARPVRLRRLLFRLRPGGGGGARLRPAHHLAHDRRLPLRPRGRASWAPRYPGGVVRLAVAVVLLAGLALALRRRPGSAAACGGCARRCRFLACFLIYTNLHDTIGFVNPHDVHHCLVALDQMIFGVQPCVWAERFITPARTEVMQFLYLNFFWIAPSTSADPARAAALAGVPRRDPGRRRLLLHGLRPVRGASRRRPRASSSSTSSRRTSAGTRSASRTCPPRPSRCCPVDSRAAFPSLHAAASLVALVFAWRYLRWWFWVLLPFALGPLGLDDLPAPPLLRGPRGGLAARPGWRCGSRRASDAWWARQQRALGYEPARAPGRGTRPSPRTAIAGPSGRRPGPGPQDDAPTASDGARHFAGCDVDATRPRSPQARVKVGALALRGE